MGKKNTKEESQKHIWMQRTQNQKPGLKQNKISTEEALGVKKPLNLYRYH